MSFRALLILRYECISTFSACLLLLRYASQYSLPAVDADVSQLPQNSLQSTAINNVFRVSFSRDCIANNAQDKSFNNNFLVFGYGPLANGGPVKHVIPPTFLTDRLQVACGAGNADRLADCHATNTDILL